MRALSAAAAILLITLSGCGPSGREPWLGYVEGEDAFIAAPQPGWITTVNVKRGDMVKQGEVLFTLDDTSQLAARDQTKATIAQIKAQIMQLQSQLNYADKELHRQRALVQHSAGTQEQLDLATNNFAIAQAQIRQLEAQQREAEANLSSTEYQLTQRKVVALTSGTVEDIYFRTGEYAPASTPVISLLPPKNVFVRFFVPEKALSHVHLGEHVRIACDGCRSDITATITFIAQQEEFTPPVIFSVANRDKLVFKLEARAPGGLPLNPGQPVDVTPLD